MKLRYYMLLALVALVALGFARYYLSSQVEVQRLACADISQSCGNDVFTVRFLEVPQVMKPLTLVLNTNKTEVVRDVHVSFAMQSMEMGLNRYRLVPQAGAWQAMVTLPVCAQGRSDWNVLVEIEMDGGIQRFTLPFTAIKK